MNKILEILSKPFVPKEYFVTNSQMFVGESLTKLFDSVGNTAIRDYHLGKLSMLLQLEEDMNDKKVISILREKGNGVGIRMSFLDLALHIEERLLDDNGGCEVIYVAKAPYEMEDYAISIETRDVDGRLEIQAFESNKSSSQAPANWKVETKFLIKA